jgi:glycosyltransferase involved in cell wall biosynthesis
LIEAMSRVRTSVKLILAGSSAEMKHYEDLIKTRGVGDRVTIRGFVSDEELIELYANSLGVCYLPFDEDYGYVTLEAMLAGKPVVVPSDGGGAAELVEHEQTGLITKPDPQAIAECLDSLYADRTKARKMGERGLEKLSSMNLSWEHVVEKLIDGAGQTRGR